MFPISHVVTSIIYCRSITTHFAGNKIIKRVHYKSVDNIELGTDGVPGDSVTGFFSP